MDSWSWDDHDVVAANRAGHLSRAQAQVLGFGRPGKSQVGAGIGLIGAAGSYALVDGRLLGRRKGTPELPPAGWYQMFWRPDDASARRGLSGWLLSVSAPPTDWPRTWSPVDADAARRRLPEMLGFDTDDLAANRQGRLTDTQQLYLTLELRKNRVASGLVAAVGVFMVVLLGWILFGRHDDDSLAARLAGAIWPAIGLAAMVVTFIAMARVQAQATAALRTPAPVERVVGPVMRLPHDDGDQIGTPAGAFGMKRFALDVFEPDRSYVVFYVAEPPLVLSAEPAAENV